MGIRPSLLAMPKNHTLPDGVRLRYPPTFFVYMARDVAMADWIELDAEKLKSQASIPSAKSAAYAEQCCIWAGRGPHPENESEDKRVINLMGCQAVGALHGHKPHSFCEASQLHPLCAG